MQSVFLVYCSNHWAQRHSGVAAPELRSRHNCIQRERDGGLNALINSLSYYIAHIKQSYKRVVEERQKHKEMFWGIAHSFSSSVCPLVCYFYSSCYPLSHFIKTSLDTDKLIITFDWVLPQYIMTKLSAFRVNAPFQRARAKWVEVVSLKQREWDVAHGNKKTRHFWDRVPDKWRSTGLSGSCQYATINF